MIMKIMQLQTRVCDDKQKNLEALERILDEHLGDIPAGNVLTGDKYRPDLVALGEMFACPYQNSCFPVYAEPEGGETWQVLSGLARRHRIYLAAGSMPERDGQGRIFNTAYVFDRDGRQIAKHRKAHMFDICVEGGQYFRESDTLTPGDEVTVFDTEFGKIGLCICFDIRFPELAREMALRGAKVVLVPAAFNMTTGPAHWELTFRARALDNQCYYVGTSPARDPEAGYVAWGHSIVTSPWGEVLGELDEKEGVLLTEIDLSYADKVRRELPLLSARRPEVYKNLMVPGTIKFL